MTFALIYHDIAELSEVERVGFPGLAAARYKLEPRQFEAHLDAIATAGVQVGLLSERPHASLTFDDGGASALSAAEALERRGWRGHFFVTTGRIGTPGFMSADEVAELARRGHEIGSHSDSHPTYIGSLPRPELAREWTVSREILTGILGRPPTTAAAPGGFVSPPVIEEAARAGYELLMTSEPAHRPARHDGMLVHGRYTVWSTTSAARAAAYARGEVGARAGLWLAWQAKNVPKRISPRVYETVRQAWARSGPDRLRRRR